MQHVLNYSDNPFPYVFVDNFYNEHELKLIWQELDFLCYSDKLEGPHETAGSLLPDKSIAKQNRGLFLDETYHKRSVSNILKVNVIKSSSFILPNLFELPFITLLRIGFENEISMP